MTENKVCPKCNGAMSQGKVLKLNEFVARNQYMYVFAPDGEPGPSLDLSKMIAGKSVSNARKPLVAFCCDACGFTELYGQAAG